MGEWMRSVLQQHGVQYPSHYANRLLLHVGLMGRIEFPSTEIVP